MRAVIPHNNQPHQGKTINQSTFLNDTWSKLDETKNSPAPVSPVMELSTGAASLADFDHLRITAEKDIPHPVPTITIAGAAIASPGNITGISAAAKAGKTALTGVILAGAISTTGEIDGFNDLTVIPNSNKKAVIHLDTEQSEADQQDNLKTIIRRAAMDSTPDYYRAYNIRQLGMDKYQDVTNSICDLSNKLHGGIHLIIVDGGADYLASVNDEEKARAIVQYFIQLAIKYSCPVIIVIHQNPGSDKERGHFGSEVQRKCYGLLSITREGDISTLQPKIMRKAGNSDIPLITYQYCKNKGYHVPVHAPDREGARAQKIRNKIEGIASRVFAPPSAFRTNDAIRKIAQAESLSESTAKRYLKDMDAWGLVVKGEDEFFRLNMTRVNRGQPGSTGILDATGVNQGQLGSNDP